MLSFKMFFEKQAFQLNEREVREIKELVRKYLYEIQPISDNNKLSRLGKLIPKTKYDGLYITPLKGKNKPREILLGSVEILDRSIGEFREIEARVAINCTSSADGLYDSDENAIYIFHDAFQSYSPTQAYEIVMHEFLHAAQYYKKMSPDYQKAIRAKQFGPKRRRTYYTEPMEFEAQIGGVISAIKDTFHAHLDNVVKEAEYTKNTSTINYYLKKLETFIKSIQVFAKTPIENYISHHELPLPLSVSHRDELFKTIQSEPKRRREYMQKFTALAQQMVEEANDALSKYNLKMRHIV